MDEYDPLLVMGGFPTGLQTRSSGERWTESWWSLWRMYSSSFLLTFASGKAPALHSYEECAKDSFMPLRRPLCSAIGVHLHLTFGEFFASILFSARTNIPSEHVLRSI